ncbi:hypothetical protein [Phenylobacterium sp.]|uniref:hypothetical protein n=1 Tax=Phenylobacterium sp. TaxID=1871053 RepID=UPI0012026B8A|nr:hypothetical protein [Phenylobacterium sp.]THD65042.1 MAG: hypothetical protein E8A49_00590 [Phenylobacterium sp.]
MIQSDTPPAQAATPPAASVVVVARVDRSAVVASLDLPLTLAKGARREAMVVRRALFFTSSVAVARPAVSGADGASDRYRWTLAGYLQRQYCVQSLAGVFACTAPDVEALPDKASGEAPLAKPDDFPLAQAAEQQLTDSLKARADAVFAADRQAAVDPLLKAAGVKPLSAPGAGVGRK